MRKSSTIDVIERRSYETPPTRASISLPDPREPVKSSQPKNVSPQPPSTPPPGNNTSPRKLSVLAQSDSRPRSKSLLVANNTHKRTNSGNILSRISFFRTSSSEVTEAANALSGFKPADGKSTSATSTVPFPKTTSLSNNVDSLRSPARSRASSNVEDGQEKGHRRQGSLRKTALLTGGKLRIEGPGHGRSRSSSNVDTPKKSPTLPYTSPDSIRREHDRPVLGPVSPTKRIFAFELPSAASSTEDVPQSAEAPPRPQEEGTRRYQEVPERRHSELPLLDTRKTSATATTNLSHFVSSPVSLASPLSEPYTSASVGSDGEHPLRLHSPPAPPDLTIRNLLPPPLPSPPSLSPPSSDSSLRHPPHLSSLTRRRPAPIAATSPLSPLSASVLASPSSPSFPLSQNPSDDWDYRATEWWGWIILLATWVVVVVGMGSCLGVWSWAWDVGRKAEAPPELQDDPTLPIVGYYPALMVLTAFMSWVWVVVAWMGMKYFKHAKIQTED